MTTKQFKEQHRAVATEMSLRSWARYISAGSSTFSVHAKIWLKRKGLA